MGSWVNRSGRSKRQEFCSAELSKVLAALTNTGSASVTLTDTVMLNYISCLLINDSFSREKHLHLRRDSNLNQTIHNPLWELTGLRLSSKLPLSLKVNWDWSLQTTLRADSGALVVHFCFFTSRSSGYEFRSMGPCHRPTELTKVQQHWF